MAPLFASSPVFCRLHDSAIANTASSRVRFFLCAAVRAGRGDDDGEAEVDTCCTCGMVRGEDSLSVDNVNN